MILESSSFRDYSSVVAYDNNKRVFRYLHKDYLKHYNHLMESGLYQKLVDEKLILAHQEKDCTDFEDYPKILFPEQIPFISYPYEWSFSQIKAAALLTLKINKLCLEFGMILKDASSFNIQFIGSRAVFIDTASFEICEINKPWKAYNQFCRHFLAPIALSAYADIHLRKLMLTNLDGIPLKLCSKLLPKRAMVNLGLLIHIFLNAFGQDKKVAFFDKKGQMPNLSKAKLISIVDHLYTVINSLQWKPGKTQWANYYANTNYNAADEKQKSEIIEEFISGLNVKTAIDLGANDGKYSQILERCNIYTISVDIDEIAVENNYLRSSNSEANQILPLQLDFVNPTPSIGWDNTERKSFFERTDVDLVLALALIHHLVITFDIKLETLAKKFAEMGRYLIVEFPQPEDEKVQIIAQHKEKQFKEYTRINFENVFEKYFELKECREIAENKRILFLYERKG